MKYAEFKAVCPYEIGDKIKIVQEEREEVHTITDIVCMHYLKTGAVNSCLSWTIAESWYLLPRRKRLSSNKPRR